MIVFITPQRVARDSVDARETVQATSDENGVNGGGRNAEAGRDLRGAEALPPAQRDDLPLHVLGCSMRDAVRAA